MMTQKKAGKRSSAIDQLRGKTKEELTGLLAQPGQLIPYLNQYVEEHAGEAEDLLLSATLRSRRRLLSDLANTKPDADGIQWFQTKWKRALRAESPAGLAELGEQLRYLWSKPRIDLADRVLNQWLAGRPAPAPSRGAAPNRRPQSAGKATTTIPFLCSLGAGRLVPDLADLRALLIQGVFENWRHLCVCANVHCAAPYFVARRKDQVVCDAEICKAEKQRAHALKWWHENRGSKKG
jgi:hypothetical protein